MNEKNLFKTFTMLAKIVGKIVEIFTIHKTKLCNT